MANNAYRNWKQKMLLSAREKRAFISGQFELTGRCNLDCKMCYVHTLDHCAAKQKELSTEEWKKVFDEAYAQGMLFATLTGGECLLRPDFQELYLHLWKRRVMVTVFTNGTMITEDHIAFFKKYRPAHIQISLYGSSEEGYLQVTGHRGFAKTVSAIESLMTAGIDVKVAVTPSHYMKEDYISILRLCRERGFRASHAEMVLSPNRENPDKNDHYLSTDEIVSLSVRRAALYKEPQPVSETPEPKGCETCPSKGLKCTGGNCVANVSWDGKMDPCPRIVFGQGADVRELGFAEAWERTKAAASEILLPVECIGCAYDKVCVRCPIARSPKMDGHCDPAICELTRRLVAAGVKKLESPEPEDLEEHGL